MNDERERLTGSLRHVCAWGWQERVWGEQGVRLHPARASSLGSIYSMLNITTGIVKRNSGAMWNILVRRR